MILKWYLKAQDANVKNLSIVGNGTEDPFVKILYESGDIAYFDADGNKVELENEAPYVKREGEFYPSGSRLVLSSFAKTKEAMFWDSRFANNGDRYYLRSLMISSYGLVNQGSDVWYEGVANAIASALIEDETTSDSRERKTGFAYFADAAFAVDTRIYESNVGYPPQQVYDVLSPIFTGDDEIMIDFALIGEKGMARVLTDVGDYSSDARNELGSVRESHNVRTLTACPCFFGMDLEHKPHAYYFLRGAPTARDAFDRCHVVNVVTGEVTTVYK